MIEIFLKSYNATKAVVEDIVIKGIYRAFLSGFVMATTGSPTHRLVGLTVLLGLTSIVVAGAWKIILKVIGHRIYDSLF